MKKGIKLFLNVKRNKLVRYVVIPTILILFWIISSILFSSGVPFSVITQNSKISFFEKTNYYLFKNALIKGQFLAKENNLGIVSIRFVPHQAIPYDEEDTLIFKIKEKGTAKWYSQNFYRSGLIYGSSLFPFGFPVISNSKNKEYQFLLISLYGNRENAIALSFLQPNVVISYQIPKQEIFKNPHTFLQFIYKKLQTTYATLNLFLNSTFFLLPLFIYFILIVFPISKISISPIKLQLFVLILALYDSIFIVQTYIGLTLIILGLWIVLVIRKKVEIRRTYLVTLFFLFATMTALLFGFSTIGAKLAFWSYLYLFVCLVQSIFILRKSLN